MSKSDYDEGFRVGWEAAVRSSAKKLDRMSDFLRKHKEVYVASHYELAARVVSDQEIPKPFREPDGLSERGA